MKIPKGSFIIEVEAAMPSRCTIQRVQGHLRLDREEMAVSVTDNGFLDQSILWLGKRFDSFLLVSLLKYEWQVWWQAVSSKWLAI